MSAYVIAQINMKHKEGFKEYADKVPQTIKNFGGKYLVRAGEFQTKEGKWDFSRNVIIAVSYTHLTLPPIYSV